MVPTRAGAEVVLLRAGAEVASWPLVCAHGLDLSLVDTLARLLMEARRHGCSIRLRNACTELTALLELVGVTEVLQVGGEAERGEEVGVEEVVVPDDPVARHLDDLDGPWGVAAVRVALVGGEGGRAVRFDGEEP